MGSLCWASLQGGLGTGRPEKEAEGIPASEHRGFWKRPVGREQVL